MSRISIILVTIFFIIIEAVFSSLYFNFPGFNGSQLIISFLFLFFVFMSKKTLKNVDWFSPDLIFLFLFYLFHFGYLYLYSIGQAEKDNEVFFNLLVIQESISFVTFIPMVFFLGYQITVRSNRLDYLSFEKPKLMNRFINLGLMHQYSKTLLIIITILFWLPILSVFQIVVSDYDALTQIGSISPIGRFYWFGQYLAPISIIIFLLTFKIERKNIFKSFYFYLIILYILSYFLIGDRGGALEYGILTLALFNSYFKKIPLLRLTIFSLVILTMSSFVAVSRVYGLQGLMNFREYYLLSDKANPIVEALKEFGASFKTVNIIFTLIPDSYSYWYGKSYLDSVLIILPNFFGLSPNKSIDVWLTETVFGQNTWGRGGSIAMESYGNFGIAGSYVFFFLLGLITAKIYNLAKHKPTFLHIVVYFSYLASLSLWIRNTSSFMFRVIVWSLLILFIFHFISKIKLGFRK